MARNSVNMPLQLAIDNLKIKDIFLLSSSSEIKADYEPKYSATSESVSITYKHIVDRSAIVSFSNEERETVINLFRVYIELGAKWVHSSENDLHEGSNSEEDSREPLAKVEACFVAEYQLKNKVPQEALEEFALKNASYHIWPYWREYLMNHAERMNLPKAVLPMVQFCVDNGQR